MTTKRKLEQFILKGYKPKMAILERNYEDFEEGIAESWKCEKIYALPLDDPSGDNKMFLFMDDETHEYAKQLVEDAKTKVGM